MTPAATAAVGDFLNLQAGVLLFPGYLGQSLTFPDLYLLNRWHLLGQSGSRCALLAGWDRVVNKSRATAAVAAGASYLAGKESSN